MERAIIAIPIYKQVLSENEKMSLEQCLHILKQYPIVFIAPESLSCTYTADRKVIRFSDAYFKDRQGYNRLLVSRHFYNVFCRYEYMLIYQLDAWVFRDELLDWCRKGYSYIGSPWLTGFNTDASKHDIWKTGNGGFSLRKVSHFIDILSHPNRRLRSLSKLMYRYRKNNTASQIFFALREYLSPLNSLNAFISRFGYYNEDNFWSIYAHLFLPGFNVPEPREASRFSLECGARRFYRENGNHLPFGCHGWDKYETEFWKTFIPGPANAEIPRVNDTKG